MIQLTKKQIERQDFVDNQIFELINTILLTSEHIDWNIELIGNVRETIRRELVEKLNIISEDEFYPFIKT